MKFEHVSLVNNVKIGLNLGPFRFTRIHFYDVKNAIKTPDFDRFSSQIASSNVIQKVWIFQHSVRHVGVNHVNLESFVISFQSQISANPSKNIAAAIFDDVSKFSQSQNVVHQNQNVLIGVQLVPEHEGRSESQDGWWNIIFFIFPSVFFRTFVDKIGSNDEFSRTNCANDHWGPLASAIFFIWTFPKVGNNDVSTFADVHVFSKLRFSSKFRDFVIQVIFVEIIRETGVNEDLFWAWWSSCRRHVVLGCSETVHLAMPVIILAHKAFLLITSKNFFRFLFCFVFNLQFRKLS